jgi:hypothetical protein
MTTLFAQPYDISACGFYFTSFEDYQAKADALRNEYGQPVEEFEIQFIDGEALDAQLFEALGVHQGDIAAYLEAVANWEDNDKIKAILGKQEGYGFTLGKDDPARLEVDIYAGLSMADLAQQFVDEGLFAEIPPSIANYIDYDAIVRDLRMDYAETMIAGERYIYRMG